MTLREVRVEPIHGFELADRPGHIALPVLGDPRDEARLDSVRVLLHHGGQPRNGLVESPGTHVDVGEHQGEGRAVRGSLLRRFHDSDRLVVAELSQVEVRQHKGGAHVARLILQDSLQVRDCVVGLTVRDRKLRHGQPGRYESILES